MASSASHQPAAVAGDRDAYEYDNFYATETGADSVANTVFEHTSQTTSGRPRSHSGYSTDAEMAIPIIHTGHLKKYQVWKGNNSFCCDGRVMLGSNAGCFIFTNILIGLPYILYTAAVATQMRSGFLALTAPFFLSSMYALWRTALTEPGIIPRNPSNSIPQPPEEAIEDERLLDAGQIHVSGMVKFCSTCHIWRPKRTKHCKFCNNCVKKFDHHCPWVGNCVGERNYRFFVAFVTSAMILAAVMAGVCGKLMYDAFSDQDEKDSWSARLNQAASKHPLAVAIGLYSAIMFLSLVGLFVYHADLLTKNITTNEDLRGTYKAHSNPFDKGSGVANCLSALWHSVPPSEVSDLTELVGEESMRSRAPSNAGARRKDYMSIGSRE